VLVAPIVGTSPLFAIAMTHLFLQRLERVTWRTALGASLVAAGVALVTFGGRS
jgi:drug/metabolite transporter (DMT)-like permease